MKQAANDLIVNVNHGRLLLAQGKQQDALISLQKAVKGSPDSAEAHYYLGAAYWQTGNSGQAKGEFQEAARVSPGYPLALQTLAKLDLAQNHAPQGQPYAEELVRKSPSDVNNRLLLGEIYAAEGQSRRAEEQFLEANRLQPNQAIVHLNMARLYSSEKKSAQAQSEFETAIHLDPSNPEILSPYIDFLDARQQTSKAVALAQQFVDGHEGNAQGHMILGGLQYKLKDIAAAQTEFERAVQLDPHNVQGYLRMGQLYQDKNQSDAAIAQYEKALGLQPMSISIVTVIGNLYLAKGELEIARKYFARALEADPNFAVANANMAWIDAQEGKDLDIALGMAQRAKSQFPEVTSISDTLAWVMYKKGNYSGAIPLLRDCVRKVPDSAQYRYHLGLALMAAGQKEPGRTELQAALQMNKLGSADKEQAQQALRQAN
jgi:tetratricopeptide (TPR) repeat protein